MRFIAYLYAPNYIAKHHKTFKEAKEWIKQRGARGQYCEIVDCKKNNKIVFSTTNNNDDHYIGTQKFD